MLRPSMARLSDVPIVLQRVGLVGFAKRVWGQVTEDSLFTWAAALAYSWLFALFPFLIFLLSLVPYLPAGTKDRARSEMHEFINYALPHAASETVWPNIEKALDNVLTTKSKWLIYLGLGTSIWAASGGMAATMTALDRCYELAQGRVFYRQRLAALALTVVVAVLVLLVIVLLPIGTALKKWVLTKGLPGLYERSPLMLSFDIARWLLAIVFLISVLALVYYWGVNVKHRFNWLTPGSVFCLIVWLVMGMGFRLYVDKFGNYDKTYGTVGGVAVLLLLFYLDAVVLMIGAEINSEIDFEVLGVKRGERNFLPAEKQAEARLRQRVRRFMAGLFSIFATRRPDSSGKTPPAP